MLKFSLVTLLLISTQAFSQTINETGSKIDATDAEAILKHHNKVRAEVGVAALSWSKEISAYAQEWAEYLGNANHCKLMHRSQAGKNIEPYGENVFSGTSGYYTPLHASLSWYAEKKDYRYQKVTQANWHPTGHYTQMIWKNTKQIGVGVAACKNGNFVVVANYSPPGNYMGEYPY